MRRLAALLVLIAATSARAEPARLECLAGARPGGIFESTCRLIGEALLAADFIREPMAYSFLEGGVGAAAFNHVVTQRPADGGLVVAATLGSGLMLARGKFGKHDENAVRWVGALGADYGVIAVAPDSPYQSLGDLMAAFVQEPEAFPVGGAGAVGSLDWMKMALFSKAALIDPRRMRYIPLDDAPAVSAALQGGRVRIAAGDALEMSRLHAEKKLRILAVMAPQRLPGLIEDVPTAKEQGQDLEWANWRGLYLGPRVTDAEYRYWVELLRRIAGAPEFTRELVARRLYPFELFGEEFDARVKADIARLRQLRTESGI